MKNMKIEVGELSEKDRAERKGYPVKIKPKFKNMKIEINADQPLGEVCAELVGVGYECKQFYFHIDEHREKCKFKSIVCYCSGRFYYYVTEIDDIFGCELTTLDELKAMEREND